MSLGRRPGDQSQENPTLRSLEPPTDEHRRPNESDQLEADLKGQTGYGSYIDYLGTYGESDQEIRKLKNDLSCSETSKYTCVVLDLSRTPNSHANVNLRCRTSSPAEILTSLRHPPAESSVQILLWSVSGIDPDLVSALGLSFKIDAPFFEAVHARVEAPELRHRPSGRDGSFPDRRYQLPFAPCYAEIGGNIVTMAVSHRPGQLHSVPVVLIAGTNWKFPEITWKPDCSLDGAADKDSYQTCDPSEWWQHEDDIGGYARVLHWCLENGNSGHDNSTDLIPFALLPLVYMNAFRMHYECDLTRYSYLNMLEKLMPSPRDQDDRKRKEDIDISNVYRLRFLLRRSVERVEDESEGLIRYMNWQGLTNWLPAYMEFVERYRRAPKSAHRLEAEIRDFLQLQVGEMGLEESRKSIELSSLQIEESKRGLSSHHQFVSY